MPSRSEKIFPALISLLVVGLLWAVFQGAGTPALLQPLQAGAPVASPLAPAGWYAVYFTQPSPDRNRGGPDASLVAAIEDARLSLDVAAYDLDLWSLRDALLDAHRRGITVRVVVETEFLDNREVQELLAAGIPVVDDRAAGLMHHKFIVIDRQEVWTGSMNFTLNGAYRHSNSLLRLRSARLAENYLLEFQEMFTDRRFGAASPANTPYPHVEVDGTLVEVYFSPEDGVLQRLLDLVSSAQESLHVMAFSFTSDDLASALVDRARAGVRVTGVFDQDQALSGAGSDFERLHAAGLDVHLDASPGKMHHKVLVIDGEIVVTGSYNFTKSAETRNDENVLVIHSPAIAALYLEEYARLLAAAQQ